MVRFQFQVENTRQDKLSVTVEPWGDVKVLKPGRIMRLRVEGPESDDPWRSLLVRIEKENHISLWAWPAASVEVVEDVERPRPGAL